MVKPPLVPSSGGGVDATSRKYRRRHPLIGADGVVRHISDHPGCAPKAASQLFLIAQPPLLQRRGIASFRFGNTPFSPRSRGSDSRLLRPAGALRLLANPLS